MKLLITFILCLFSLSAYAEIPNEFNVYVPNTGIKNISCRTLFNLYGQKYNASPIISPKEGAAGMIAMLAMLSDKKISVLCSGTSESILNTFAYPGHEKEHSLLTMISIYSTGPVTFYTGANSKFTSIGDLLKLDRPITIGFHTTLHKMIIQLMFKDHPVIFVPYLNPQSSLSSLMGGELDLYTETGSMEQLEKAGKIKSLGHINGNNNLSGADITKDFPEIARLPMFISLTTSSNNNPTDIEELNKRLLPLIDSPEFHKLMDPMGWVSKGRSVKESNLIVEHMREVLKFKDE